MYLTNIQTLRPRYTLTQDQTIEWLSCVHAQSEFVERIKDLDEQLFYQKIKTFFQRFGADETQISKRSTILKDLTHMNWEAMDVFRVQLDPQGVTLEERLQIYSSEVDNVMDEFYRDTEDPPENLFHVTCTGYVAPSPAQNLVNGKNWHHDTQVTHIYHMGCYAAVSAIRMAPRTQGRTDVVHAEVCFLHFNPSLHDPEQLILQSVLSDGFAKYSLVSEKPEKGFQIVSAIEKIIPDSTIDMTWTPSSRGMCVTLSRRTPEVFCEYISDFVTKTMQCPRYEECIFAIHPTGPRMIENMQTVLQLNENQVIHSQQVLFEHGNMASATLPHIWNNILQDKNVSSGTRVISLAFGPGLTVAGAKFIKI